MILVLNRGSTTYLLKSSMLQSGEQAAYTYGRSFHICRNPVFFYLGFCLNGHPVGTGISPALVHSGQPFFPGCAADVADGSPAVEVTASQGRRVEAAGRIRYAEHQYLPRHVCFCHAKSVSRTGYPGCVYQPRFHYPFHRTLQAPTSKWQDLVQPAGLQCRHRYRILAADPG